MAGPRTRYGVHNVRAECIGRRAAALCGEWWCCKNLGGTFFSFDRWRSKSAAFVVVCHNNGQESKHNGRCGWRYICDFELCARALRLMHASANASNVLLVTVMGRRKMMKIEKIVKKKFGYRVALPHSRFGSRFSRLTAVSPSLLAPHTSDARP